VLITVSGWMNQRQLQVIDYLREQNRVLREQLGGRRLCLDDNQRRRLAVTAKALGRRVLAEIATIVKPWLADQTWTHFLTTEPPETGFTPG
jgi:hypothetical protein